MLRCSDAHWNKQQGGFVLHLESWSILCWVRFSPWIAVIRLCVEFSSQLFIFSLEWQAGCKCPIENRGFWNAVSQNKPFCLHRNFPAHKNMLDIMDKHQKERKNDYVYLSKVFWMIPSWVCLMYSPLNKVRVDHFILYWQSRKDVHDMTCKLNASSRSKRFWSDALFPVLSLVVHRLVLSTFSRMNTNSSDEFFQAANHAEQTFRKMETYLQHKQLCDVLLIAGEHKIPAHRLVSALLSALIQLITPPSAANWR